MITVYHQMEKIEEAYYRRKIPGFIVKWKAKHADAPQRTERMLELWSKTDNEMSPCEVWDAINEVAEQEARRISVVRATEKEEQDRWDLQRGCGTMLVAIGSCLFFPKVLPPALLLLPIASFMFGMSLVMVALGIRF